MTTRAPDRRSWQRPVPNRAVIHLLGLVNRWVLLRGLPVLHRIPVVRDLPLVHGHFWVRRIDLPEADRLRLQQVVNRESVAFIGPNHPEFGTDWMIDKELSTMVCPLMASWADRGIVATAPRFWGMNNLIANDGGEAARDYSVEWALRGEAVLLHPEGTVRWTNDVVHPLFPGIAQMAIDASTETEKPVYVVPVVWKYCYVRDISARLMREIDILEAGLALARTNGQTLARRFAMLQENIISQRASHFGFADTLGDGGFFIRQERLRRAIIADLESRHAVEPSTDVDKHIARLGRAARLRFGELVGDDSSRDVRAALKRDIEMADEAKRLGEFSREIYGCASLTQEQLSESLKRCRDRLLRRGWKNGLANMLPRPLGPRVAYMGVPEPIRVMADGSADQESRILELARSRMQARLDEINAQIEADVSRYRMANALTIARSP